MVSYGHGEDMDRIGFADLLEYQNSDYISLQNHGLHEDSNSEPIALL